MSESETERWSAKKSAALYQVKGWGAPYFSVNSKGHVLVTPDPERDTTINLYKLARDLGQRGLHLPLLIRFSDIVGDRIRRLNRCFEKAIADHDYPAAYRGVFPVKVNQQRHLVEDVVSYGQKYKFGLEAGSKPELLIALAAMRDVGGLIICNGYKDQSYLETALVAQKFDKTVIIVLERLEELDLVLKASKKLDIQPVLGVRAKLTAKGVGRWAASAGDGAKFGLSAAEMVALVDRLEEEGLRDCLRLLHFHVGSQVSSIIPLKNALQEAAHIYVELAAMGCKMGFLDVGGGLAVDYDGSRTDFHASKNYGLDEYAADVVATVQAACTKAKVQPPTLISESGRAVAAHHSVLVFEVVGVGGADYGEPDKPKETTHRLLKDLYETYRGISPKNVQEAWHDANQAKEEAQNLFKYGYLSLRERAYAERLFWACCRKLHQRMERLKFVPEELWDLERAQSFIYYCNFSIFQSAPDIWAIDQLFPIMPIHRLDEKPEVTARLADLTCDSDGIIDSFIDVEEDKHVLEVHKTKPNEPYYLAMFLNGAYQEILGDLHNLFGDTNAAYVQLDEGGYQVHQVIRGDSVAEVLRYVAYEPDSMIEAVRRQAERAVHNQRLTNKQMRTLMRHYETALQSYTYLTPDD